MVDRQANIQDLLGSRRGWTPIALLAHSPEALGPRLLELAGARHWRLISLSTYEGHPPPNLNIRGVLTDHIPTDDRVMRLHQLGLPMVRLGYWPHTGDHEVPAVISDQPAVGRLAAEHFAQRDFKHVACVGHKPWGNNRAVYDAFASRAAELNCESHLLQEDGKAIRELPSSLARWEYRRAQFTAWLETLPRPVGMLMFGDLKADRCCRWVLDAGLSVPTDVAVMGIGNQTVLCECATIPTSSIAHDFDRIIETAVDVLARLMRGQTLEQTTIGVPPLGVVTRQSTDVLAASDPRIVRALGYMCDHVTEDLSVVQIAKHVGVSRRTLETAFQRELKRGINQEFQRRRLEKACELLISTDLKIADLAEALNFSSHHYFCRAFRAAFDTSPARYRRDAKKSP